MLDKLVPTVIGISLAAGPAMAQQEGYRYQHGHMFSGDGWIYMFMGPVVMIAFIAVVILLVVLAFRWLSADHGKRSGHGDEAIAALRERFARGEIDEEEFEARRQTLNRS